MNAPVRSPFSRSHVSTGTSAITSAGPWKRNRVQAPGAVVARQTDTVSTETIAKLGDQHHTVK